MMEEGPVDLLDLVRLPDVLVVCSSTGWTDEKHMLYLRLLEESFVSQLHGGECSYKGLFNCSPRSCPHIESAKRIVKYEYADQGGLEIAEDDKVKSCIKVECVESPCGSQEDERGLSMDDNASTSDPVEEATPRARATRSGQSSKCKFGKRRHSPSKSTEGSDQNFDEETKGIGGSRGASQKRLKRADDKMKDQAVPSTKTEFQQVGCTNASDKDSNNHDGSSKVHAGLPDGEAGLSPAKDLEAKG